MVTLKEVAREAGVHPGTASRALNRTTQSLVAAVTVERVRAAADALGYRVDYLARSFKTRRTFSVGVLIPDINNPLFPPIVRGIEDSLAAAGYIALLGNTENEPEREKRVLDGLLGRSIDGLVLATAQRRDGKLAELARQPIPVVLVNRVAEDHGFSSASADDVAGVRAAVAHLGALGHTRIAHVAGPQSLSTGYGRFQAFISAMGHLGCETDNQLVRFAATFSITEGIRCAAELLSVDMPPTAIVAANDMLALGCYTAAEGAGLRCPDDVSIVGYNDMPFMDRLSPPLTTVRIPHYDLGARAGELLLERINHPDAPLRSTILVPQLVVRGSTGRAR